MWVIFALLSALFAALPSILAKIGIQNINSNLATAIRTVVVLIMSWGIVFVTANKMILQTSDTKICCF
jgi:transporter family protein